MGPKKYRWRELLVLWRAWTFRAQLPKFALQPGKRRWTEPKGLSSVPRRYQRPLYPRAGALRGSEDRLGIYISSKVEGVDVRFLVDTGSNITILSPAVMEKISAPRRPVLEDVEKNHNGSAKPFRGKGTFELEVEGRWVLQEVWVADIELEGILGMDFVRQYDCQIIAAPGGQLELFIPELKSGSVNGVRLAGGMDLSNYRCLRVKQRRLDTVRKASWLVVLANHERSFIVVMKSTWRASRKK